MLKRSHDADDKSHDKFFLTGKVRWVNHMIVKSPFNQHSRQLVTFMRSLWGQNSHHFGHFFSPEVQLHSLSVTRCVDLQFEVLYAWDIWVCSAGNVCTVSLQHCPQSPLSEQPSVSSSHSVLRGPTPARTHQWYNTRVFNPSHNVRWSKSPDKITCLFIVCVCWEGDVVWGVCREGWWWCEVMIYDLNTDQPLPTDILRGSFCPVMVTISDGSDKTC